MLVLSRHATEQILIGDTIRVTILGISRRGQVKLGIEAPAGISIVRTELLTRQPSPMGNPPTVVPAEQCGSRR
jgi:carbon storage regulator CsrA